MSPRTLRLLILEDNAQDAELTIEYLTAEGFVPIAKVVETEADFRAALAESFDLIITDYTLPTFDGLSAIRMVRAAPGVQPPVIVVTGTANEDEAVECMREGADDYVIKDRPARFGQAVRQALKRRALREHAEHAEAGLRASEEQLRTAQRIARMGSWEYRFADRSLTVSDGFREIFDLRDTSTAVDLDEFIARIHPDDRARVRASVEQNSSGPQEPETETEYRIVRQDGSERTILAAGEVVREAGALIAIRCTTQDITDRRQAAQHLHRSEQLFEQGFENAPVGMGLIDPQRRMFTRVNDAMCALTGQTRAALGSVGCLLRATHPEDIAADDAVYAQMVAGTLKSDERQKRVLRPDGSVGWISRSLSALRDAGGAVSSVFCQVIDITEQKQREEELKAQVSDVAWIARIRDALDHDRFVLYSQPIVDLRTGDAVQQELLLRMRDQDGSIIAPADFLPVAERYGLISEIDRWVIGEAVGLAAQGQPTQFNLSGASIGDPGVLRELARAIERTEADPSLLVVEVTETAIMTQLDTGRRFAEQVTALGCRLALDDFGTGYSSLRHLKQIPAHHLKIDIEFVRDLTRSEVDERLVRGIIGLAREFDQTTIAEGIDDQATLVRLRELGVDFGQGYLLGLPQPLPTAALSTAIEPRSDTPGALPAQDRADVLSTSVIGDLVELDRMMVSEMLSRYATGSSADLRRIRRALTTSDAPAVARAADRLRSSSLTVGAARVATIAEQLQTRALAGDLAPADDLMRDLAGALKQDRAALRLVLATLKDAGPERRASKPRRRDGAATTDRLVRAYGDTLRIGDPHAAAVVIDDAQGQRLSSVEIQSRVIAPAMWGIGELWERGALTVAQEHLATAVSHHVLTRLYPGLLSHVQRRGDTIVVAAVHGEHHVLGLRMAADVLEGAGFDVRFLGADLPESSLLAWVSEHRPAAVALGVTMPLGAAALARQLQALRDYDPEMHLIVGGQGVPAVLRERAGVFYASDTEQLAEYASRAVKTRPPGELPRDIARGGVGFGRLLGAEMDLTVGLEARLAQTTAAAADGARGQARRAFELEQLAFRDPLTGLWNRRAFDDRYQDLTAGEITPAPTVLMIDVDHFKAVNDGFGHDAGDRVLIEVAGCITRAMRPDDFASRYGGDEFAALLPDTPAQIAAQIGERIRSAIRTELTDPPVTVSIGVSVPDHADRRRAKLDVDRALYEAKQRGRNQVTFA